MSTTPTKILTAVAVAGGVVAGSLAFSSTAGARIYRHHYYSYRDHYRPYAFYPRYYGYPRYYRGAYGYAYPRVPVYNHDDATKLSRQLMGLGD